MQSTYETLTFEINNHDLLLLYTDAIYECKNKTGEEYGIERVEAVMSKAPDSSAEEIMNFLLKGVSDFTGGKNLGEDLTVILMKKVK